MGGSNPKPDNIPHDSKSTYYSKSSDLLSEPVNIPDDYKMPDYSEPLNLFTQDRFKEVKKHSSKKHPIKKHVSKEEEKQKRMKWMVNP